MKAAVRCNSLTLGGSGPKTLHSMEAHGKRLDKSGQSRRVREVVPLVHGSLDLRAAYDAHVEGARTNSSLKRPVLHYIVQLPTAIDAADPRKQRAMLAHAVRFINGTHGGRAVFAARLDRDEAGQHTVDVFAAPLYEKTTKAGATTWMSPTKFGKDLARKHEATIRARHPDATGPLTGPRHVGIALQEELDAYLRAEAGLDLAQRTPKPSSAPDRVEPETVARRKDAEAALARAQAAEREEAERLVAVQRRERTLDAAESQLDAQEEGIDAQARDLDARERALDERAGRLRRAERAVAQMIQEVADRLDVRPTLQAIRGAIRSALADEPAPERDEDDGPLLG